MSCPWLRFEKYDKNSRSVTCTDSARAATARAALGEL